MIPKIVVKNIRTEMFNFSESLNQLDKLNYKLFYKKEDFLAISNFILITGFTRRLNGLLYLINLNYKSKEELITLNYQNCDGANILLRGALESVIIMNILSDSNDQLSYNYFIQNKLDLADISKKFNKTSKYLNTNQEEISDTNRFFWIKSLINKKVISLIDLLKLTDFSDFNKSYYKSEILHNNNLSHPKLKNDSVILDGMFGSGNTNEVIYFFETIVMLIHEITNILLKVDNRIFNEKYAIDILAFVKYIPNPINYQERLNNVILSNDFIISEDTNTLLGIRKKEYNTDVSHADNIQFWVFNYLFGVREIKNSRPRLFRTLDKLIESLAFGMQELILSFENKYTFIFFTKLRYMLELMSVINILLDMDEDAIEIYQAHTDILSFLAFNRIPKQIKDHLRERGLINVDPNRVYIPYEGGKKTTYEIYLINLKQLENYFYNKYNLRVAKGKIKHVNGWAINLIDDKHKPPSNTKLIEYFAKKVQDDSEEENINYIDFSKGLYTLICSYCHATSFSVNEFLLGNDKIYMNESYSFLITSFDFLMKKIKQKFSSIDNFYKIIKDSQNFNENTTLEYSISKILNDIKKSGIIN